MGIQGIPISPCQQCRWKDQHSKKLIIVLRPYLFCHLIHCGRSAYVDPSQVYFVLTLLINNSPSFWDKESPKGEEMGKNWNQQTSLFLNLGLIHWITSQESDFILLCFANLMICLCNASLLLPGKDGTSQGLLPISKATERLSLHTTTNHRQSPPLLQTGTSNNNTGDKAQLNYLKCRNPSGKGVQWDRCEGRKNGCLTTSVVLANVDNIL